MKKIILWVLIYFVFLCSDFSSGQYFQLVDPTPTAPKMVGCVNSFNIIIDSQSNTFPNAVADVTIWYNSWSTTITGFTNGTAYVADTTTPRFTGWIIFVSRFNPIGSVKTNALFGIVNFVMDVTNFSETFTMPFNMNSKTDGNNFPDNSNTDLLQYVSGLSYSFFTGPCVQDLIAPAVNSSTALTTVTGLQVAGNGGFRIASNSSIQLGFTDNTPDIWWSNQYWYNFLMQYVPGISDNQRGVDSSGINITVSQAAYTHKIFFPSPLPALSTSYNRTSPQLTLSPSGLTRERLSRNTDATLNPGTSTFYPERAITISGVLDDRTNRRWTSNIQTFSFTFNQPQQPIVTPVWPAANQNVLVDNGTVQIKVEDTRAGVDLTSLSVTMSWIVYTWGYTGFSITTGLRVTGDSNYWDYAIISIVPKIPFTFGQTISVTVNGNDLVNTSITSSNTYTFNRFVPTSTFVAWSGLLLNIGYIKSWSILIPTTWSIIYTWPVLTVIWSAYLDGNQVFFFGTSWIQTITNTVYVGGGGGGSSTVQYLTLESSPSSNQTPTTQNNQPQNVLFPLIPSSTSSNQRSFIQILPTSPQEDIYILGKQPWSSLEQPIQFVQEVKSTTWETATGTTILLWTWIISCSDNQQPILQLISNQTQQIEPQSITSTILPRAISGVLFLLLIVQLFIKFPPRWTKK